MAFDATVAGATANSYLAVAEADAFATADVGASAVAWTSAVTSAKQNALMRATREVSAYLRSSGLALYSTTQALLYPRAVDVLNGTPFIPNAIRFATYAQAKFLNANADVLDAAETRKARGIESGSEPNVSWTLGNTGDKTHLCDEAEAYLTGTFAQAASVRSVVVGTAYSYPSDVLLGTDLLS